MLDQDDTPDTEEESDLEELHINDVVDVYDEELTESQRLTLKLGAAASEVGRSSMEPMLTQSLRQLRNASVQEAKDNEYYLRGEMPPRFQDVH